jgi:hypothetical protein
VHYYGVLEVMRRGDYRYDGGAWEGSRVGHNYGGETIQGVVPFYFSKYAPQGSVKVVSGTPTTAPCGFVQPVERGST